MTTINLSMYFEGPFRAGTGIAGHGVDEVVDLDHVVTETAVKGILRSAARILLPSTSSPEGGDGALDSAAAVNGDSPLIKHVFGELGNEASPWNFMVQASERIAHMGVRANVRIGDDGSVKPGALLMKEEVWMNTQDNPVKVVITSRRNLDGKDLKDHCALLRLSALLVDKIGQKKSRGMGWVSMSVDDYTGNSELFQTDLNTLNKVRCASTGDNQGTEDAEQ